MTDDTRQFHALMNVVGIRAPLTAAALVQLIHELEDAGALKDGAVDRIKDAVIHEAEQSRGPRFSQEEFETMLREQLDRLFNGGDREQMKGH